MALSEEEWVAELLRRITAKHEEKMALDISINQTVKELEASRSQNILLERQVTKLQRDLTNALEPHIEIEHFKNKYSHLTREYERMSEEYRVFCQQRGQASTAETAREIAAAKTEIERLEQTIKGKEDAEKNAYIRITQLNIRGKSILEASVADVDSLKEAALLLEEKISTLEASSKKAADEQRPAPQHRDQAIQVDRQTVDIAIQTDPILAAPAVQSRPLTSAAARPAAQNAPPRANAANAQPQRPAQTSESRPANDAARRPRQPTTGRATSYELPHIPEARRQLLEAFPEVDVPAGSAEDEIEFSRPELSAKLGGGQQGVDGKFGPKLKPLAQKHELSGCIYPQRHLNIWLPRKPGEHGYLFLGLRGPGRDHEKFLTATPRAMFVCEGKSRWRYYGLYTAERNPERDLTMEEWQALPDEFKLGDSSYSAMTLCKRLGGSIYDSLFKSDKPNHDKQVAEIRTDYDEGRLRVPCITLQCVGYNEELIADLKNDAAKSSTSSRTNVRKVTLNMSDPSASTSLGKRKRTALVESDSEDNPDIPAAPPIPSGSISLEA